MIESRYGCGFMESLYNKLFRDRPVTHITGARWESAEGKKHFSGWDKCVLQRRNVNGDVISEGAGSESEWQEDIYIHGGLPNWSSWRVQFPGMHEPTLADMERAIAAGQCLPYFWDYSDSVRRAIEQNESLFREIHGRDLSDYLRMTIEDVRLIGKEESAKAGIKVPRWNLVRADTRVPTSVQTTIQLWPPDVPYIEGIDVFIIYYGINPFGGGNAIMTVGGRGQGTAAADALLEYPRVKMDPPIQNVDLASLDVQRTLQMNGWKTVEIVGTVTIKEHKGRGHPVRMGVSDAVPLL